MWYRREEQHYRISLFFSAASLAGAFGGILAWVSSRTFPSEASIDKGDQGIAHMKGVGGLNGWRWIFILEGILTVLVSAAAYFFIFKYVHSESLIPLLCSFLSNGPCYSSKWRITLPGAARKTIPWLSNAYSENPIVIRLQHPS